MPAPLGIPRMEAVLLPTFNWADASLGRKSVVMMAPAKARTAASVASAWVISWGRRARILSACRGTPIIPVEDGKTCRPGTPKASPTAAQICRQAIWPAFPVAQLALPELTSRARMRPRDRARWSRPTWIGAAATRLVGNRAAADVPEAAVARARAGLPLALMPAVAAE